MHEKKKNQTNKPPVFLPQKPKARWWHLSVVIYLCSTQSYITLGISIVTRSIYVVTFCFHCMLSMESHLAAGYSCTCCKSLSQFTSPSSLGTPALIGWDLHPQSKAGQSPLTSYSNRIQVFMLFLGFLLVPTKMWQLFRLCPKAHSLVHMLVMAQVGI